MRIFPLLLAVLLIAPMASAQSMDITSAHQVRIAYGDIPSTPDQTEPSGAWNVEQRLVLTEGANGTVTIPSGHVAGSVFCGDGCDFDLSLEENTFTAVCLTAGADGHCNISFPHTIAGNVDAFGLSMRVTADSTVLVYALEGLDVRSGTDNLLGEGFYYPNVQPALLIHQFAPEDGRFWMTVSPHTIAESPTTGGFGWQGILVGLLAGVAVWYLLVRQGLVQKRQRKQVAGTAAHKQIASSEDKTTLEWRRRALLAALKELEVARVDQTIDLTAYDALKADFKKQTVAVMRALEELGE